MYSTHETLDYDNILSVPMCTWLIGSIMDDVLRISEVHMHALGQIYQVVIIDLIPHAATHDKLRSYCTL